jgi:hypothetical protein
MGCDPEYFRRRIAEGFLSRPGKLLIRDNGPEFKIESHAIDVLLDRLLEFTADQIPLAGKNNTRGMEIKPPYD